MSNDRLKKKHYVPYILINIGGILLMALTYTISKNPNSIGGMGGSFVLIFLIIGAFVCFYIVRPLSFQSSFVPIVIAGIIFINLIAYLEMSSGVLNKMTRILYLGCIVWTLYWFLSAIFTLIKPADILKEKERSLRTSFSITLGASMFISVTFIAITHTAFSIINKYSPQSVADVVKNPFFKYTTISLSFLVAGLIVSLIYLLKIKDENMRNLIVEEKICALKYDARKIKKYFFIVFLLFIILGSIFETQRGMWVMWVETVLLVLLMSLIIWKICKHVFISNDEHA